MGDPATKPRMWCNRCRNYTICPQKTLSQHDGAHEQCQVSQPPCSIHHFRRAKICDRCGYDFESWEVEESVISNLIGAHELARRIGTILQEATEPAIS